MNEHYLPGPGTRPIDTGLNLANIRPHQLYTHGAHTTIDREIFVVKNVSSVSYNDEN